MDDEMSPKSLLILFMKNTTIPTLSKIPNRRTIFLKLFWATLLLILLSISVWQAVKLLVEYNKFDVQQITYIEALNQVAFPSITICTNQPINWRRMLATENPLVEKINQSLDNAFKQQYLTEKSKVFIGNEILMKFLRNMTYNQRFEFAYQKEEFIKFCLFEGIPCTEEDLFMYNNLYYGNCFTFNSGFVKEKQKTTKTFNGALTLLVEVERDFRYPYLRREVGPLIYIHQIGSSPLMDPTATSVLYPGNWNAIKITKRKLKRLPPPYTSACINATETSIRKNLFQYTKKTPYFYTIGACLSTCNRNSQLKHCGCVHAKYISHNKTHDVPVCDSINECKLPLLIQDEFQDCDCRHQCEQILFDFERETDRDWLDYSQNQKSMHLYFPNSKEDTKTLTQRMKYKFSVINIYFNSFLMETKLEVPKDELLDLLGDIGGNIVLLVGISLVSLTEILELAFLLLRQLFRMLRNKVKILRISSEN